MQHVISQRATKAREKREKKKQSDIREVRRVVGCFNFLNRR